MRNAKRVILILVILVSCVGCDQVTKTVARNRLPPSRPIYLIGDVFLFQLEENVGSFLGLGSSLSASTRFWLLTVISGVMLVGILVYVLVDRSLNLLGVVAASLFIGGGVSNLIDRMFNEGRVIDFMNMGIGNLRTGVFNVADVAIMVGAGLLVLQSLWASRQEAQAAKDEGAEPQ